MQAYFVDSALVKTYREESGSQRVLGLLSSGDITIVSKLARLEVMSALHRLPRAGANAESVARVATEKLEKEFQSAFAVIELSDDLLDDAVEIIKTNALRAADAIQLASARKALLLFPDHNLTLLSSDKELNRAAQNCGIHTINPTE
jgi:predicted nucleic acid-binding protein